MSVRHQLSKNHPVIGEGYRLLQDADLLEADDQTNCVSTLLSLERFQPWRLVMPEWKKDLGKSIKEVCENTEDADGAERVFRRRIVLSKEEFTSHG